MTAPAADIERCVTSLMQMARDLVDGKITPADVEGHAVEQCEALFAQVVGEGDPLWELQNQVARKVIAFGGVPHDELAEWCAVFAPAEEPVREVSWIEQALADGAEEDES